MQTSKAYAPADASPLFPYLCLLLVGCGPLYSFPSCLWKFYYIHMQKLALNDQKCLKVIKVTHYKTSSIDIESLKIESLTYY